MKSSCTRWRQAHGAEAVREAFAGVAAIAGVRTLRRAGLPQRRRAARRLAHMLTASWSLLERFERSLHFVSLAHVAHPLAPAGASRRQNSLTPAIAAKTLNNQTNHVFHAQAGAAAYGCATTAETGVFPAATAAGVIGVSAPPAPIVYWETLLLELFVT